MLNVSATFWTTEPSAPNRKPDKNPPKPHRAVWLGVLVTSENGSGVVTPLPRKRKRGEIRSYNEIVIRPQQDIWDGPWPFACRIVGIQRSFFDRMDYFFPNLEILEASEWYSGDGIYRLRVDIPTGENSWSFLGPPADYIAAIAVSVEIRGERGAALATYAPSPHGP